MDICKVVAHSIPEFPSLVLTNGLMLWARAHYLSLNVISAQGGTVGYCVGSSEDGVSPWLTPLSSSSSSLWFNLSLSLLSHRFLLCGLSVDDVETLRGGGSRGGDSQSVALRSCAQNGIRKGVSNEQLKVCTSQYV